MNTRLQVEHPVTELVTGIDLVEQMIRVAAGEKLKLKQSDVKLNGWAVESRIYAEDPYRNFLPSIGRLVSYRPPREASEGGLTVRNDTGVTEGGEISMYYDPMIAKLVTHAPTREAAIDLQSKALDAFHIDGIRHNIPFLTALMQHPRWRKGNLSTGFIAEEFRDGFKSRAPSAAEVEALAAVAAAVDHLNNERRRHITGQMGGQPVRFAKRRVIRIGEIETQLDIAGGNGKPMLRELRRRQRPRPHAGYRLRLVAGRSHLERPRRRRGCLRAGQAHPQRLRAVLARHHACRCASTRRARPSLPP